MLDARVAPLRPGELAAAGTLLGRAFVDDPVIRYYFPQEARRPALCTALMTVASKLCLAYGRGFTLHEDGALRAVALLLPPGTTEFPITGIVRALSTRPSLWRLGSIRRYFAVAGSVDAHRPAQPLLTLMTLGVDVSHQRRGLGSRLLKSVSSASQTMFLETYNATNLSFYEAHGFEVDRHFATDDGRGPACWTMTSRRSP